MLTRLLLLALLALPIAAQNFPKLCQDPIPGTGGFGNLRLCAPTSDVYAGSTLPSPLLGKDGDLYRYNSGTVICWMGPKKNGDWGNCAPDTAGPPAAAVLPLVPCSSIPLPPAGTTVLVVTNAAVGTSATQIAQAQCLAGFRVVTLDGIPIAPTAEKSPDLLRQLNTVMALVQGAGYASWAVRTLRAGQ